MKPPSDRAWTSAPVRIKASAAPVWFCAAAHINAVWPRQPSVVSTTAPWTSSARTALASPVRAAAMSGVSPSGLARLASAPASSSRVIMGVLPLIAASASGVTP